METTIYDIGGYIVDWGYIGIMEKTIVSTIVYWPGLYCFLQPEFLHTSLEHSDLPPKIEKPLKPDAYALLVESGWLSAG